jgi:hypothetical protein
MFYVEQMQFRAAVEIQCENLVRFLVEMVLEASRVIDVERNNAHQQSGEANSSVLT